MTTELLLATGTDSWAYVQETLTASLTDLLDGTCTSLNVSIPDTGQHVEAHLLGNGQVRLAAAGNDSLVGGNRLTVRDERAVIAVGFSVESASWGTFYWDWTPPVAPEQVASGIVRTVRDIYKTSPANVEVTATL